LPFGVAIAGACSWKVGIVEPLSIASESGFETDTLGTWKRCVGHIGLDALDGITPLVETATLVELIGLPEPRLESISFTFGRDTS